jgi:predicted RNA-binding protein with TRAM domain
MSFRQNRGGFGNRGGSSSSGGFGSSFKKPVEVGKEYDVTISDVSRRGDGIAKLSGFVIFVPGTRQGQAVRIKVTQVGDRYANGQIVDGPAAAATTTSEPAAEEKSE